MKYFIFLFTIFLIWSCGNTEKTLNQAATANTNAATNIDTIVETSPTTFETYYIAAKSGLRMRKTPSLSGEKMDVVPYGAEISVANEEETTIPPVGGFKGAMVKVNFEGKTGYAFNGFLSSIPVPEKNQSLKQYVRKMKIAGFEGSQTETLEEITHTQTLSVPTTNFQEAFLIAQRLGWIIGKFDLPNPKNPNKTFAVDTKDIKRTVRGKKLSEEALVDNELSFGEGIYHMYHLPFPDPQFADFNMIFSSSDYKNWNSFQMNISEQYRNRKITITPRQGSYLIIHTDVGE